MGEMFRSKSTFDADLFCSIAGHGMTVHRGEVNRSTFSTEPPMGLAVEVRNAYKSFGRKNPVLQNLNLSVESGTIYSLLGSSGCGKTTLLLSCVGLQKLDKGEIKVFGESPGTKHRRIHRIGYMPQELSLYNEFSIKESLHYYGRLYGMSDSKIQESMDYILKLLELPSPTRRIGTLSGGQKRRVSFAIATFHRPLLLILDEPTVGVDPLLRESIWSFLRQLVSAKLCSIVITTHYIEEARQSNTVGVMRNGRLLVENSPQELMNKFKLPLLEQVVLALCRNDTKGSPQELLKHKKPALPVYEQTQADSKQTTPTRRNYTPPAKSCHQYRNNIFSIAGGAGGSHIKKIGYGNIKKSDKESSSTSSLQEVKVGAQNGVDCCSWTDTISTFDRIKALTMKNFVVLLRSVWFLLFIFVVPAVQIVLICLAIGPDPKDLGFGVINDEINPDWFNGTFNSSQAVCPPVPVCGLALSCKYLNLLPKASLDLKLYDTEEDAMIDIRGGKIWGFLRFPENYSEFVIDRGGNPAFALDETYDGSRITFEMDMSNQQIGQNLKKIFIAVYYKFLVQVSAECNLNPRQFELPLNFKSPVYGSDGTSFSEFLAPSVFLGLLFFFPLCSSGITYISEKKIGTLSRTMVAGVSTLEIMVAFLISQMAVLTVQSGLAFLILTVAFEIPVLGSLPLALVLAVLVGIGGMSMGFLISVICTEEIHAVLLAIGSFFPNFLLAGMVWPIQGMPYVLQYIAYLLPCTLACESMRSIVSRGWQFTHPSVYPGFISTVGWIAIYWALTIVLQYFKSRS